MDPSQRRYHSRVNTPTSKTKETETGAPDFEQSLTELEDIVARLESGELTLDESLKQFERGVQLTRRCQTALKEAEQKVEILLRKDGEPVAFNPDSENEDLAEPD
jgi:exodeoxyribonuclease VII small subunit